MLQSKPLSPKLEADNLHVEDHNLLEQKLMNKTAQQPVSG